MVGYAEPNPVFAASRQSSQSKYKQQQKKSGGEHPATPFTTVYYGIEALYIAALNTPAPHLTI